jgi:hypothetical protein
MSERRVIQHLQKMSKEKRKEMLIAELAELTA